LQNGEHARLALAVNEFFETPMITAFHSETNFFPAVCTIRGPGFFVAVQCGTRTPEQFALQGFQSVRSPTNYGAFSTVPLWYAAANRLHALLAADGATANDKVFFVGHSYGAAANAVLNAMYRRVIPDRTLAYFGIGCPKIGDERFVNLVAQSAGVHLSNDDDIVTILPPDYVTYAPLVLAFPFLNMSVWNNYFRPPAQRFQTPAGELDRPAFPLLDYDTLFNLTLTIVTGNSFSPVAPHYIGEYLNRIKLRCPGDGWPVDSELVDLMNKKDQLILASATEEATYGTAVFTKYPAPAGYSILLETGDKILLETGDLLLLE
jgi:pimeloyl-ACP methyl ester carboxylesterase